MLSNNHLIIFTRFPEPGKTKTRLIPALGPEKAAELQQEMTERIASQALNLKKERNVPVTFFFTGATDDTMAAWLGNSFNYRHQGSGNIGRRMGDAFTRTFRDTSESVILVGSDIPELTTKILSEAFISLKTNDTIIGPSRDGGYYLIGLRAKYSQQLIKTVFDRIPWSTADVLESSIQRLVESGYTYSLLQTLCDIDRPEDIHIAEEMKLL
jgi:rSAM/selenodomain-associated transferase 1